jgi:CRP-like cAMP-binding protein
MKGISETIRENPSFRTLNLKKGEQLFDLNEAVKGVFMIKKGRIKLLQLFGDKRQAMWIAEESEIIGITSFFSKDHCYQFAAVPIEDSTLVFIPDIEFQNILDNKPKLNLEIIKKLCLRISFVEQLISSYTILNTKKRVQEIIKFYIKRRETNKRMKLPYSISDIADMAGSTPTYILKLLKEMHNSKLVHLKANSTLFVEPSSFVF